METCEELKCKHKFVKSYTKLYVQFFTLLLKVLAFLKF